MCIFTRINGKEALQLPLEQYNIEQSSAEFRRIYSNPLVCGRSEGAALSDLFWYWLAPGPEMHQEHLENGPRYEKISKLSRRILTIPRNRIESIVDNHLGQIDRDLSNDWQFIRIRDLMMPFWAKVYYEIVFQEPCSEMANKLIVDNANNVVTALKGCGLRNMKKRKKLTDFLIIKLQSGQLPFRFPADFSIQEQAYYLQGTFFNTAIVQMSEAMMHLIMAIAQHPMIQKKMVQQPDDKQFYDQVIHETLRLYPLFGIAHRITSKDVKINGKFIKQGSVICFNYPAYHKLGYQHANTFQPHRWNQCPIKEANHIPFGINTNRPCPAQAIALLSMRRLTQNLLKKYRFSSSAKHSRSMPSRGPCLVASRKNQKLTKTTEKIFLLFIKIRDQWEDVGRSLLQLILSTIMVIDARRLKLCENYFTNLKKKNPYST